MKGEKEPGLLTEAEAALREGIGLVLCRWSALELAVQNEWGGRNSRQKADLINSQIFSWFTSNSSKSEDLYIDDLEGMLFEGLLSLNTEVDDGSIEEVAEKLMIMHEECLAGNFKSIEALQESNHLRVPVSHVRQENNDDDDDDENMDEKPDGFRKDGSSNMTVSMSKSVSNSNSDDMLVDKPAPEPSAKVDDGWVVVVPKKGRGKRN